MSYSILPRYIPDTLERCILSVVLIDGVIYMTLANDAELIAWVNHPDFAMIDDTLQAHILTEINNRIAFKLCALCEII